MRKAHNALKTPGITRVRQVSRKADNSREKMAEAIHHCLKYLSRDARRYGMAQTASLLDMVAHLAVDEANAAR